ncbi:OmpA/MotB domain protein [Runella slithyformis DSM 19594]|uniref:OmpA/MotB domain protein n=2 Tax=Runella TaxID=105 RepID=A0A7U3ZIC7_RUNSL|nr:OmpA/MotB domain protein [Runella slithyformis DSM 19594]
MKTAGIHIPTVKSLTSCTLHILLIAGLSDCTSTPNTKKSGNGTASAPKQMISRSKSPANYAIAASTVGGAAGSIIEGYMQKQTIQLSEDLNWVAKVERIGEGIKITMNSAVLFGDDTYALSNDPQPQLKKLAETLLTYKDTEILVAGHTDGEGEAKQNQVLSEKRAEALADFLQAHGVPQLRIVTQGFGEQTPKVSNGTEDGRRQNQRIEVAIVAGQALKKQAKREAAENKKNG